MTETPIDRFELLDLLERAAKRMEVAVVQQSDLAIGLEVDEGAQALAVTTGVLIGRAMGLREACDIVVKASGGGSVSRAGDPDRAPLNSMEWPDDPLLPRGKLEGGVFDQGSVWLGRDEQEWGINYLSAPQINKIIRFCWSKADLIYALRLNAMLEEAVVRAGGDLRALGHSNLFAWLEGTPLFKALRRRIAELGGESDR